MKTGATVPQLLLAAARHGVPDQVTGANVEGVVHLAGLVFEGGGQE